MPGLQLKTAGTFEDDGPLVGFPAKGAQVKDSRFVLIKSRLVHEAAGADPAAAPLPPETGEDHRGQQLRHARPDEHEVAFRLLEEVRSFIPRIIQENHELQQDLVDLRSQAEADIEAAEARALEWKNSSDAFQDRVEMLEAMVLDLRTRLQRSESVVAIEKELSSKAAQEAAEAECLAKLFEDTVISSFGIGSLFQDALARIEAKG